MTDKAMDIINPSTSSKMTAGLMTSVQLTKTEKADLANTAARVAAKQSMSSLSVRQLINIMHGRFKQTLDD